MLRRTFEDESFKVVLTAGNERMFLCKQAIQYYLAFSPSLKYSYLHLKECSLRYYELVCSISWYQKN